jgi:hypothetical protein
LATNNLLKYNTYCLASGLLFNKQQQPGADMPIPVQGPQTAAGGTNKTVAAQTAGWVRLMEAAENARSNATGGLAQATIAKAMASYGAGSAGVNPASAFAASRR